jgi:hypothetical protein
MPMTRYLREKLFDPEAIEAMHVAFTNACVAHGLTDTNDPLAEQVAAKIIELAQDGVRDPIELTHRVLEVFRTT